MALGRGINMGNMFEAPTEEAWGNPWKSGYFKLIADLGFQHVRLPVRWEPAQRSLAQPPYTIAPEFLQRIQHVVQEAQAHQLLVVLNMHHHEELMKDPQGQRERFIQQWSQIAEWFSSKPDTLHFELLNEPHENLTAEIWNGLLIEGLEAIRYHSPNRPVVIGPAGWGGINGLEKLALPNDNHLILSIHYYEPFKFTHQGADWLAPESTRWLGTRWQDLDRERETIRQAFLPVLEFSKQHGTPIYIGEFGAFSRADINSRVLWTRFLARYFEEQGFSWAYWEFSSGFGIYNPQTNAILQPLVNALLHDSLPDPQRSQAVVLYQSEYGNGFDNWILLTHGTAMATSHLQDGGVAIQIEINGQEAWHVQWVRTGFQLNPGSNYRVMFRASAQEACTLYAHIGRNGPPWSTYNGYPSFALNTNPQEFSFDVLAPGDVSTDTRIVLDLGLSSREVRVEEIRLEAFTAADG
jgi:aryl-phospho-beta-D-glucosidase BglC (GH1 family)